MCCCFMHAMAVCPGGGTVLRSNCMAVDNCVEPQAAPCTRVQLTGMHGCV